MVVAKLRVRHLQRRENVLRREFPQRLSAHALYDRRQQKKSRVAVEPVASGGKIQGLLAKNHLQRVFIRRYAVRVDSRQVHQRKVIAQPARMIQQMKDRQFLSVVRKFRNVFPDFVVDGKFALLFQEQNARRRKLFGCRAYVEHALRRYRHVLFHVRKPISFGIDHLAAAINAQRASRRTWFRQVHEDFIDRHCLLLVGRIPSRRNRAAENNHARQKSCANPPANRHFSRSALCFAAESIHSGAASQQYVV